MASSCSILGFDDFIKDFALVDGDRIGGTQIFKMNEKEGSSLRNGNEVYTFENKTLKHTDHPAGSEKMICYNEKDNIIVYIKFPKDEKNENDKTLSSSLLLISGITSDSNKPFQVIIRDLIKSKKD